MKYIVLDFETYYDPASGYSLKKMSYPEYIGHKDFKVHCLGVEWKGQKKILWGDKAIREWLSGWRNYKGDYAFVFHNAFFDAAILAWHYDFVPARMLCTLLMTNHVLGSAKESGGRNGLADVAKRLGFADAKGRLDFMEGVREPNEQERAMLEAYLNTDLSLTRQVLDTLLPHVTNPDVELWLLDHTLRLYATRPLTLDYATVDRAERLIEERRSAAFERLIKANKAVDPKGLEDLLSSNAKFEGALMDVLKQYGVPIPTKIRKVSDAEKAKATKLAAKSVESEKDKDKYEAYLEKLQKAGAKVWQLPNGTIEIGDTKSVPALAKKDEDFIRLSFSPYEGVASLVSARLVERSAITAKARLQKMRRVAGGIGKMPVHLVYFGAHTGRWSGGGGFNFQNLTNPDREADPGKRAIASAIRESFVAPDGYVFVSADASQIEARFTGWVAGQWDLLDRFRQKLDVYSLFISDVLGEDIHKPVGGETPEAASHLKMMRGVGKEAVLGLGFSMGWRKFMARLREDPKLAQQFEDGKMDEAFCKNVVYKYRDLHPDIVNSWKELNNAFFHARAGGIKQVGPVLFRKGRPVGSTLPVVNAVLPSGRVLYYRNIRQEAVKDGRQSDNGSQRDKEWKHGAGQRLYGGLILENVVQALSREHITESLIRSELDYSLPVVLHVHDSIVVLSKEDEAEKSRDLLVNSLRVTPDWAGPELALDAEGKIGKTLVT